MEGPGPYLYDGSGSAGKSGSGLTHDVGYDADGHWRRNLAYPLTGQLRR